MPEPLPNRHCHPESAWNISNRHPEGEIDVVVNGVMAVRGKEGSLRAAGSIAKEPASNARPGARNPLLAAKAHGSRNGHIMRFPSGCALWFPAARK